MRVQRAKVGGGGVLSQPPVNFSKFFVSNQFFAHVTFCIVWYMHKEDLEIVSFTCLRDE